MTFFTDIVLALFSLYLGKRINDQFKISKNSAQRLWSLGFFMLALASLLGGIYHGMGSQMSPDMAKLSWKFTTYFIGLTGFYMVYGSGLQHLPVSKFKWLKILIQIKLIVYLVVVSKFSTFNIVIANYMPDMLFLLALHFYTFSKDKNKENMWIVYGILISFASSVLQQLKIGIHMHFNHNDLYHVLQMVAVYMYYKTVRSYS